jgi:hypothetical protein
MRRLGPFAILGATSLALYAVSAWLLFKAGCAGDTKGGSYGDPLVSLSLENAAFPFFLLAVVATASLIAWLTPGSMRYRVAATVAFVLVGIPVLWLMGLQVESWGLRHCF